MITEIDKKTIYKISKKYRAKRVLLFGSSLKPEIESRDIDIAVEGILPKDFFSYYGDIIADFPPSFYNNYRFFFNL